ncbi:hypothetical protein N7447_008994 [Penicillium robsamsonii]|uniref:uncharacterized protein n=1 Tax=Penicillium robsamsonii TaxID=1792511 RepID=UPI00254799FA|nr:uncharacterized protein N7447_008994 [Penicillium robsamsonii]KAJ5816761.1 hypothetical protein N7447_008994 [Penicillium robsamsonii]
MFAFLFSLATNPHLLTAWNLKVFNSPTYSADPTSGLIFSFILIWILRTLPGSTMEPAVILAVLVELTKELVTLIDNTTPETNHTNPKANTIR